ncbi:NGG1p interacting factor 3 [Choiromyces venosus 120613-1]|uniref:NGG1p interacting factor 3 n=1 Tax=Choiromyces venosus 120613-1 TaxID=1336337 RepID=A0A3N4JXN3_9PEZI|nr:NGG1p interacting factor 3 [Choiromyces venosus 120613-1]
MSSNAMIRSRTLRTVVNAVQKLYPQALADKTWDNTGLLLEAPDRTDRPSPKTHKVLLTIDLTKAVADEAISLRSSVIVAYHPIIFRPLKSLTLANTQQESLLKLAQEGISVYSPHTAVDATIGGVNDWLADGISGGKREESGRVVIEGVKDVPDSGMGRIVTLNEPKEFQELVDRVKAFLGLKHVMIGKPPGDKKIRTIAICAGSGASMFKNVDVDLLFTGELSHHDALAAKERGVWFITCFHTNTERGFLRDVMKGKLTEVLRNDVEEEGEFEIVVSERDRDPFEIV